MALAISRQNSSFHRKAPKVMPPKLGAICGNNKSFPVQRMCVLREKKRSVGMDYSAWVTGFKHIVYRSQCSNQINCSPCPRHTHKIEVMQNFSHLRTGKQNTKFVFVRFRNPSKSEEYIANQVTSQQSDLPKSRFYHLLDGYNWTHFLTFSYISFLT